MASKTSASVNIVFPKGALVTVRVDDPGQFFSASAANSGASLLIGVSSDSFVFHRAALLTQDASSRTYQVLIPFDRQTRISVTSSTLQLVGSSGNLLSTSNNAMPVLVPSGQQPRTVTVKIVGRVNP
jgi:hypothetical protein